MFTVSILVVLLRLNFSKILPAPRAFSADSWNSRQYPDLVLVLLALSLLLAVHYSGDVSIKATLEVAFFVSHGGGCYFSTYISNSPSRRRLWLDTASISVEPRFFYRIQVQRRGTCRMEQEAPTFLGLIIVSV